MAMLSAADRVGLAPKVKRLNGGLGPKRLRRETQAAGHKLGKQKVSGRRKTRQHGVTFCRACPLPYFYHIPGKGFRELVTLRLLFAILLSLLEGFPKRKSGIL